MRSIKTSQCLRHYKYSTHISSKVYFVFMDWIRTKPFSALIGTFVNKTSTHCEMYYGPTIVYIIFSTWNKGLLRDQQVIGSRPLLLVLCNQHIYTLWKVNMPSSLYTPVWTGKQLFTCYTTVIVFFERFRDVTTSLRHK